MKHSGFRTAAAAAVSVFTVAALVWYFFSGPPDLSNNDILPAHIDFSLSNVKYTCSRNGAPRWTLAAERAERDGSDGITRMERVRVVFYARDRGETVLTANYGEIYPDHSTVKVSGNVRVKRGDGGTLLTDFLEYSENTGLVVTDSAVHFRVQGLHIKGVGMRLDTDRHTVRLLEEVEAVIEDQ